MTFRNLNLESRNGGWVVDFVTGPGMGECYKDKLRNREREWSVAVLFLRISVAAE